MGDIPWHTGCAVQRHYGQLEQGDLIYMGQNQEAAVGYHAELLLSCVLQKYQRKHFFFNISSRRAAFTPDDW